MAGLEHNLHTIHDDVDYGYAEATLGSNRQLVTEMMNETERQDNQVTAPENTRRCHAAEHLAMLLGQSELEAR